MDRRNFFKILSATSAGAMAGCGGKSDKLIPLLVAEHEIVIERVLEPQQLGRECCDIAGPVHADDREWRRQRRASRGE